MRLNKFLARAGIASRRKCDQLIEAGKVIINGRVTLEFNYQVDSNDIIICDGVPIETIPKRRIYIVNKLKGYISTSSDPSGRKKVIDLVRSNDRLFTVGRLDRDTTGAILVTNDGQLANNLMHPRSQVEKIYFVRTKTDIPYAKYTMLTNGLQLDGKAIAHGKIKRLGKKVGGIHWNIMLHEGKYHEVKRIFKALGATVNKLHRYSFAGITADDMHPGECRELNKNEIHRLIKISEKHEKN